MFFLTDNYFCILEVEIFFAVFLNCAAFENRRKQSNRQMFIFPQPPYSLGATQHFSSREWRLGRESFARSQNYFSTENYFPPFVCFCFGFRVTLNIKIAMYQFSRETLICHQTNAIITDRVILPRTQGEGKHRIYSRLPVTCDLKTPPKKKQQ